MPNILFITLEFPPQLGGVGRMYQGLCQALNSDNLTVWAPPLDLGVEDILPDKRYRLHREELLAKTGKARWIKTIFSLRRYLKTHKVDFIIVGQILPLGIAVWVLSFFYNIPYGVFVHGMDITVPIFRPRKRLIIKRILKRARVVFAANNFIKDRVLALGVEKNKFALIYPAPILKPPADNASVDFLRRKYELNNYKIILTIGRLVKRKGHDIVMKSLARVWQQLPNTKYIIIGDGPAEKLLKELATTLSHPNLVYFLGSVNDEETKAWLSLSDIFIMTPIGLSNGDVEGFGIVYLEAALFEKPSIGSVSGGVAEAVVDKTTGLLVAENNTEVTSAAIIKLLEDPILAAHLGANGRKRVENEFTFQKSAGVMQSYIEKYL